MTSSFFNAEGWDERLALVVANTLQGEQLATSAKTGWFGILIPTVSNPEVTKSGVNFDFFVIRVKAPGRYLFIISLSSTVSFSTKGSKYSKELAIKIKGFWPSLFFNS